jgi:hypothetical protein
MLGVGLTAPPRKKALTVEKLLTIAAAIVKEAKVHHGL